MNLKDAPKSVFAIIAALFGVILLILIALILL